MLKDRAEEWWELVQLDGHAVLMESTGWCRLVPMQVCSDLGYLQLKWTATVAD